MIKDKDTIEKINKFLELSQNDTLTPRQVDQFITAVLTFIKKSKDEFDSLSKENIEKLGRGLRYIAAEHKKVLEKVSGESESLKTEANKRFDRIEKLIKEVKSIEVRHGKDADEDLIVNKILSLLPKPEPTIKLTAENIRDLLEQLVGDERFRVSF